MQTSNKIGEDLQIECVARYGVVFQMEGGKPSSEYWQVVWDWLRQHHAHICNDPTTDYPTHKDNNDIELLNEIWNWQEERYNGSTKL